MRRSPSNRANDISRGFAANPGIKFLFDSRPDITTRDISISPPSTQIDVIRRWMDQPSKRSQVFLEEEEEGDIFFYYSFLSFPSCVYMIYICIFEIFVETFVLFFSFFALWSVIVFGIFDRQLKLKLGLATFTEYLCYPFIYSCDDIVF